jgi:hypothetical protein
MIAKRITTKVGEIFSVELGDGKKKYFQYIANDLIQLNSDLIRVFEKIYPISENVDYAELLLGEIDFHAHTMINVGVKQSFFLKEGKENVIPDIGNILFRDTNDYGRKEGNELIRISNDWYVWRINDRNLPKVGPLTGENRTAEIGIVYPPFVIAEKIKTGKFNFFYPDFE